MSSALKTSSLASLSSSTSISLLLLIASHYTHRASAFPFSKPEFRYTEFSKLDETAQIVAVRKLGYTAITWNVHGLADIEKIGWWQMTPTQLEGAKELGFTEDTWDCFIHHYQSYTWSELETYSLTQYYEALGWDELSWSGQTDGPDSEAKWWGQLTDDEKIAAKNLCYFEDNWNMGDMNPNNSIFPFPKPDFRYVPWEELSAVTQNTAAGLLGYDEDTWNMLGTNIVEANTFLNLEEGQRDGILSLGFYIHTWDCFMNHYQSYYWSSLYGDRLQAVLTLGWTEEMWNEVDDGGDVPESELTLWAGLTPEQRAAATELCYFEETWDGYDLEEFYDPLAVDTEYESLDVDASEDNVPKGSDAPDAARGAEYSVSGINNSSSKAVISMSGLIMALSVAVYVFA